MSVHHPSRVCQWHRLGRSSTVDSADEDDEGDERLIWPNYFNLRLHRQPWNSAMDQEIFHQPGVSIGLVDLYLHLVDL